MKKMIGLVLVVLIFTFWTMPEAGLLAPMLGLVATAGLNAQQLKEKRAGFIANARALISKAKAAEARLHARRDARIRRADGRR